jgi:hypothetical protein
MALAGSRYWHMRHLERGATFLGPFDSWVLTTSWRAELCVDTHDRADAGRLPIGTLLASVYLAKTFRATRTKMRIVPARPRPTGMKTMRPNALQPWVRGTKVSQGDRLCNYRPNTTNSAKRIQGQKLKSNGYIRKFSLVALGFASAAAAGRRGSAA